MSTVIWSRRAGEPDPLERERVCDWLTGHGLDPDRIRAVEVLADWDGTVRAETYEPWPPTVDPSGDDFLTVWITVPLVAPPPGWPS